MPKDLYHPTKGLLNIQDIDDNEGFNWSIVRHWNSAHHHPVGIKNADKDFAKKLDFKNKQFSVEIRGIHKIENLNKNKEEHSFYVSKILLRTRTCWLIINSRRRKKTLLSYQKF